MTMCIYAFEINQDEEKSKWEARRCIANTVFQVDCTRDNLIDLGYVNRCILEYPV